MIARFASALVLLFSAALPACGQSPEAKKANAEADGSVWVVESATTKMYLCGTIHLLRKDDYPLPNTYDRAYADSQRLVFELPPGAARDPQLMKKMQSAGTYPAGESLFDKIKPETAKALNAWTQKRGMPPGLFASMRPWFVALMISATEYSALGADPTRGVDHAFEKRGTAEGKPGEGLETIDFQVNLFADLSEEMQKELLEQTLVEVEQLAGIYQKMIDSWRSGDADALHQMLFEEAEKYPDLLDKFLTQRNAHWIAQLEGYLKGKEHVMVLVGGGHLGGKEGVIHLLREKGYKITKLVDVPK